MGVISLGQPSKSPRQLSSHLQLSQDTVFLKLQAGSALAWTLLLLDALPGPLALRLSPPLVSW